MQAGEGTMEREPSYSDDGPRDECHARGIVADIGGRAASRKSASRKLGDHRRLAIAREAEVRAQSPIVGEERAQETDEGCAEKPVRSGKAKQHRRIGQGRDMRRDDVTEDE